MNRRDLRRAGVGALVLLVLMTPLGAALGASLGPGFVPRGHEGHRHVHFAGAAPVHAANDTAGAESRPQPQAGEDAGRESGEIPDYGVGLAAIVPPVDTISLFLVVLMGVAMLGLLAPGKFLGAPAPPPRALAAFF